MKKSKQRKPKPKQTSWKSKGKMHKCISKNSRTVNWSLHSPSKKRIGKIKKQTSKRNVSWPKICGLKRRRGTHRLRSAWQKSNETKKNCTWTKSNLAKHLRQQCCLSWATLGSSHLLTPPFHSHFICAPLCPLLLVNLSSAFYDMRSINGSIG